MTSHPRSPGLSELLEGYLEGTLAPAREAEIRARLEREPALRRELAARREVLSLLSVPLDEEPPADLATGILAAVRLDRERRARVLRLPARVEQALVLVGAASLAAFVAVLVRAASPQEASGWVGKAAVAAGRAVSTLSSAGLEAFESALQLDWAFRLVATLFGAGRTAIDSSAAVLLVGSLVALALTATAGWVLLRSPRGRGGLGHASLA